MFAPKSGDLINCKKGKPDALMWVAGAAFSSIAFKASRIFVSFFFD